ncbi:hypothetical protein Rhe02_55710 [Rhizocola hellebori]|uniref:Uncharacterized protein n=1 Tax=Rhizocola hellebori TaxID=1392758 RepID=A0A8J3QCY2_9ACTN|nr:hypothetical protein [Rhizocola hellebori]GIH07504.1 hypothetical protein Rhe02_55710 [Rhizocola hellebori]
MTDVAAGQKILAAHMQDHETRIDTLEALGISLTPLWKRKTSIETVNNSAVLQNDDVLFLPVLANTVYHMEMRVIQNSGTTPDFKAGWTYPSGLTMLYNRLGVGLAGGGNVHLLFNSDQTTSILDDGFAADRSFMMWGYVAVSTTPGTLQFQWAQNTANASNTSVLPGSYLKLTKV